MLNNTDIKSPNSTDIILLNNWRVQKRFRH